MEIYQSRNDDQGCGSEKSPGAHHAQYGTVLDTGSKQWCNFQEGKQETVSPGQAYQSAHAMVAN